MSFCPTVFLRSSRYSGIRYKVWISWQLSACRGRQIDQTFPVTSLTRLGDLMMGIIKTSYVIFSRSLDWTFIFNMTATSEVPPPLLTSSGCASIAGSCSISDKGFQSSWHKCWNWYFCLFSNSVTVHYTQQLTPKYTFSKTLNSWLYCFNKHNVYYSFLFIME